MAQFPIRIKRRHFAGLGRIAYDSRAGDLASILQGIVQYLAQQAVGSAKVGAFTDNSGGTAASPPAFVNAVIPTAPFDASSSAVGATSSTVNTALGAFLNAGAVIADQLNRARARIGLPNVSWASGTIATAGTIPAQTTSVSGAEGTSAVDYTTGVAAMLLVVENLKTLQDATNEVLYALGESAGSPNKVVSDALVVPSATFGEALATAPALVNISNPNAATAPGSSSISATVFSSFLAAVANNIATIAWVWNHTMNQGSNLTNLTDNTGGTATSYGSYALTEPNATPATATGAATTSVGKTAFDGQLTVMANSFSSLADRLNDLREINELPVYANNVGGTVSTTLAAMSSSLVAVDGSSSGNAANFADLSARMSTVDNILSSLTVGLNQVLAKIGVAQVADTGPLGTASTTLPALAATGTAATGGGQTMLNTAVNTWLANTMNSISTLAAAMNQATGSGMDLREQIPVVAVAG